MCAIKGHQRYFLTDITFKSSWKKEHPVHTFPPKGCYLLIVWPFENLKQFRSLLWKTRCASSNQLVLLTYSYKQSNSFHNQIIRHHHQFEFKFLSRVQELLFKQIIHFRFKEQRIIVEQMKTRHVWIKAEWTGYQSSSKYKSVNDNFVNYLVACNVPIEFRKVYF